MRRVPLLLSALAAGAAWLAFASPARACDCPMPGVEVLPRLGTPAALNTHVFVFLPPGYATTGTLAVKVRPRDGAPVEIERRQVGLADVRVVEVIPKAPLARDTRYEVLVAAPGGREAVVGEFRTGAREDRTAPRWTGLEGGGYVVAPRVCCDCSTGDPFAVLFTGKASDDVTAEPAVLYGIWVSDPEGRLDTDRPPLVYARAHGGRLQLGHPSRCLPANFTFPARARKMRLAVRAMDLAGNAAEAGSVVLDLTRPLAAPPAAPPPAAAPAPASQPATQPAPPPAARPGPAPAPAPSPGP